MSQPVIDRALIRRMAQALRSRDHRDPYLPAAIMRIRRTFESQHGAETLAIMEELFATGLSCKRDSDDGPGRMLDDRETCFNEGLRAAVLFLTEMTEAR